MVQHRTLIHFKKRERERKTKLLEQIASHNKKVESVIKASITNIKLTETEEETVPCNSTATPSKSEHLGTRFVRSKLANSKDGERKRERVLRGFLFYVPEEVRAIIGSQTEKEEEHFIFAFVTFEIVHNHVG